MYKNVLIILKQIMILLLIIENLLKIFTINSFNPYKTNQLNDFIFQY